VGLVRTIEVYTIGTVMQLETRPPIKIIGSSTLTSSLAVVLLPQCRQPLLLGVCVDVGTDHESDQVEEGNPDLLWEELLRKCQGDRRCGPGYLHDGHETCVDGRANLVEGACTSNDGHGGEVDGVLDGRDLEDISALACLESSFLYVPQDC